MGNGTITTNGAVLDNDLVFDATHGPQQSLAFGTGGTLNLNLDGTGALGAGYKGAATLRIADGVAVASSRGYLGARSGSTGTATVTGTGSKWTNSGELYVGNNGSGTLTIAAGGQVSSTAPYLGYSSGSTGTATVTGTGSKWTNSGALYVGYSGSATGTLTVQAGAQLSNTDAYLGYSSTGTATVTVTGAGSKWINSGILYIGSPGKGTVNLNDGGTLQVATMGRGFGTATFNWNDGAIQNYDAATDLTIPSGLTLKLAATGTHAFNIDLNRTATVAAVLANASTAGTLTKTGPGTLVLTAANTYTGATDVSAGKLMVNGSLANTSVSVHGGAWLGGTGTIAGNVLLDAGAYICPGRSLGTLRLNGNLSLASGALLDFDLGTPGLSDLIAMPTSTLFLDDQQFSDFTFRPLEGFGQGTYTLIDAGAVQGSLGSNTGQVGGVPASLSLVPVSGGRTDLVLTVVPEPSTLALLGVGAVGLLAYVWRRRKRAT